MPPLLKIHPSSPEQEVAVRKSYTKPPKSPRTPASLLLPPGARPRRPNRSRSWSYSSNNSNNSVSVAMNAARTSIKKQQEHEEAEEVRDPVSPHSSISSKVTLDSSASELDAAPLQDEKTTAAAWIQQGNLLFRQRQYPQAKDCYQKAIKSCCHDNADESNPCYSEPSMVADALANLGAVHWASGDVPTAIHLLQQALARYEELDMTASNTTSTSRALQMATAHHQLGLAYCLQQDLPRSMESLRQAHSIRSHCGDQLAVAKTLNAMGQVLMVFKKDVSQALVYHQEAFEILHSLQQDTVSTLEHLAKVYEYRREWQHALACWQQVLQQQRSTLSSKQADTLVAMAKIYRKMGLSEQARLCHKEVQWMRRRQGSRHETL